MPLKATTYELAKDRANRYNKKRREKLALKSRSKPLKSSLTRKPISSGKGAQASNGAQRGIPQRPAKRLKRQKGIIYADSVWSWAVRARDDHRCQRCGKRDEKNNHAHHVAPRSRRPDLKKVMSNGKTVCPPCHDWIHSHPIEAEAACLLSSETYEAAQKAAKA